MDLPGEVRDYFALRNKFDIEGAIAQFEDTAIVEDEDAEYRGRDSILAWMEETQNKYRPTFEVLSAQQSQNDLVIAVIVSGTFPGSPLPIDHAFVVFDGKITRLVIG